MSTDILVHKHPATVQVPLYPSEFDFWTWTVGLIVVSLIIGGLCAGLTIALWRKCTGNEKLWDAAFRNGFSSADIAMGVAERLFFTIGIAFNISGIAIGMVSIIGIKMAAGWNLHKYEVPPYDPSTLTPLRRRRLRRLKSGREKRLKQLRMSAIAGGLVSILLATLGGLICAGRI